MGKSCRKSSNINLLLRCEVGLWLKRSGVIENLKPRVDVTNVFGQYDTDVSGEFTVDELRRAL